MDGKIEAGKCAYLITHAYYHILCKIEDMLGPQRGRISQVRLIVSSRLSWTDFFARGCTRDNTTMHNMPPGEVGWFDAFEWEHRIP